MRVLHSSVSNLPIHFRSSEKKDSGFFIVGAVLALTIVLAFGPASAGSAPVTVMVGSDGFSFSPESVTIQRGDTVKWTWSASGHSSTAGTPGVPSWFWDSGILNQGATFSHTFNVVGSFPYYCTPHGGCGMIGTVTVSGPASTPTPTPAGTPAVFGNISTRLLVETGNNVLIGGFIITGTQPKKVIVRAIGPSLSSFFSGALADPVLELRDSSGGLIRSNDNWRSDQEAEIMATGIPPTNDLESAIVRRLMPGIYTAIVRGVNNATGIALIEAYGWN